MPRVWDVPVRDWTRVHDARAAAEAAAALAGLDERRTAAAALVATELATNLLKHAAGGRLLVEAVPAPAPREEREQSRVVQLAAIDHGPGIGDVPSALRDGFSTTGSLGAGLGTCRRLADTFTLDSTPGRGTIAVARLGTTPRGTEAPPVIRYGAAEPAGSPGLPAGSAAPDAGQRHGTPAPPAPYGRPGSRAPGACGGPTGHAAFPGAPATDPLTGAPDADALAGAPDGTPPRDAVPPGGAARGAGRPGGAFAGATVPGPGGRVPAHHSAERHATRGERFVPLAGVRAGGLNIPYGGAEYSGDAWAWVRAGDTVTLMLADGLGHGPEAARASSAAVTALHRCAHLSPADALRRLHDALKGTRGAAVSLARLDLGTGRLRFAGIGNVGARLRTGGTWRHLLARPGIVGVHRPTTLREEEADWTGDPLLILHTDGLPSRWAPPPGAGLPAADPAVTAAVTIRDASSPARPVRDDTAVAVLTPTPPELP